MLIYIQSSKKYCPVGYWPLYIKPPVGNTIIFVASNNTYAFILKDNEYLFIGDNNNLV